MVNTRRLSADGRIVMEHFEKRKPRRYLCAAGVPTIAMGHVIKAGETFKEPLSEAEIDAIFAKDIKEFEDCVNINVSVPLTQAQFDGAVLLCFNIGKTAFKNSTFLRLLNKKLYLEASQQFAAWNKAKDPVTKKLRPLAGLTRRRKCEQQIFLGKGIQHLKDNNWFM